MSYFYIQRIDKQLLVISIGPDSPFEFIDILIKNIQKEMEHLHRSNVDVYFDLLSCVGNNENRYSKFTYVENQGNTFIDSLSHLKAQELPYDVSQELRKFYSDHLKEALRYSILTNKEKNKFAVTSVA